MTPRPRALLFDWDNTLVDSWSTIHEALVATLDAMGHVPWSLAETKQRVRLSLREAFPILFGERWETARTLYLDTFRSIHLQRLTAMVGASELLSQLATEDLYLAVVSNKTGAVLRREAEHLGWSRYFRRLVGAGDANADKPDAAPVRLALAGSGIGAGATWFIGDTDLDMECAINAGCVPVLFGRGEDADATMVKPLSQLHFLDYDSLLKGVRGL